MGIGEFFILGGVLLITTGVLYLFRQSKDRKVLEVSLEDLSRIWLKYNQTEEEIFEPGKEAVVSEEATSRSFDFNREISSLKSLLQGIRKGSVSATSETVAVSSEQTELLEPAEQTEQVSSVEEVRPVEGFSQIEQVPAFTENAEIPNFFDKTSDNISKDHTENVLSTETKAFLNDIVEAYRTELEQQNAYELVTRLVGIMERHGEVPSVVTSGYDKETIDLASVKNLLIKINLRTHTYNVCYRMLQLLKENYMEHRNHVPKALVVALAHDLGKIPAFQAEQYTTAEHPIISEMKLGELASECQSVPAWLEQAKKIVRQHHVESSDQFVALLKKADADARASEMMSLTASSRVSQISEWFSVEKFVKKLIPHINVTQMNKFRAISWKSYILVDPDLAYEIADEIRKEENVIDPLFLYVSSKETLLKKIVEILRASGMIAPVLKEGHYFKTVNIQTPTGARMGKTIKRGFIPLMADAVVEIGGITLSEIESRKEGLLEIVNLKF